MNGVPDKNTVSSFSYYKSIFGLEAPGGDTQELAVPSGFFENDLGQERCQNAACASIQSELSNSCKQRVILLHAFSQGTATVTNGFQKLNQEIKNQNKKINALILEGFLGSSKNAVLHTMSCVLFSYLPFARWWLPACAKLMFPSAVFFDETKQPISTAKTQFSTDILPQDAPIIIVHNRGDLQLPINDARKLYKTLKAQGRENVYLVEANKGLQHMCVLDSNNGRAVGKILYNHGVFFGQDTDIDNAGEISDSDKDGDRVENTEFDPAQYQPTLQEVDQRINDERKWKRRINNCVDLASTVAIGCWAAKKMYKHVAPRMRSRSLI